MQRLASDLPVEADYSHLREGNARTHPDRQPPVQRSLGHHSAGIPALRRNVLLHGGVGAAPGNMLPFFVGASFRRCCCSRPVCEGDPNPKTRGPPETLHEGQIEGGGGDGGERVWSPRGWPS